MLTSGYAVLVDQAVVEVLCFDFSCAFHAKRWVLGVVLQNVLTENALL